MMDFKKALQVIAGSEEQFTLEHRIFNCTTAVSLAIFFLALCFMVFQKAWPVVVLIVCCLFVNYCIYRLSRFRNRLQLALFFFYLLAGVAINGMWMVDRGPMGSASFFFFVLLLVISFTAVNPVRYLVVMLVDIVVLGIIDGPIQAQINWSVPESDLGQNAAIFAAVVFSSILVMFYRQLITSKHDDTFLDVIEQITNESDVVNRSADTLAESSDHLLKSALQQKSATEQLATTTEELSATSEQNHQLADTAMDAIKDTEIHLDVSKSNIHKLAQSINKIRISSGEIQSINNVINDIAFQSNILALNAMIEASRAGETHGGFQVVALEVKKLADRSAEAAENINRQLKENMHSVQEGVELSDTTQIVFDEILQRIHPLFETICKVSDFSSEQNEAIRQITIGLMEIDRAVDDNKNLAQETSLTANELRSNASSLEKVVKILKENSQ